MSNCLSVLSEFEKEDWAVFLTAMAVGFIFFLLAAPWIGLAVCLTASIMLGFFVAKFYYDGNPGVAKSLILGVGLFLSALIPFLAGATLGTLISEFADRRLVLGLALIVAVPMFSIWGIYALSKRSGRASGTLSSPS